MGHDFTVDGCASFGGHGMDGLNSLKELAVALKVDMERFA